MSSNDVRTSDGNRDLRSSGLNVKDCFLGDSRHCAGCLFAKRRLYRTVSSQ